MVPTASTKSKAAKKPASNPARAAKPAKKPAAKASAKAPAAGMTLDEVMRALKKAGTAQARKTYARHGAVEPMFGVSFATLKSLYKKIRVDHDLALALWDTGNYDARNLAFKIVDPAKVTSKDLDRWADDMKVRMCAGYVSALAAESPHGFAKVAKWLAASDEGRRSAGWWLVASLAMRNPEVPEAWFFDRLKEIERQLQAAPNDERYAMNHALICIGGRSPALRKATLAAAKKIGKVDVDHGDTSCKTPEAAPYIENMWARAAAAGFATPALHEQSRESPRTRC
jgi:3-methyladenine DNA glycosylase AlkD